MGVMFQAFYWDCPAAEGREHRWWTHVKAQVPVLARAGVTALWLPPANKAADWKSMGYDPYDYYDLGEYDQKGGVPTWYGTKEELLDLIGAAHAHGLQVYADLVFNHNSGGDNQQVNPIDDYIRWTEFLPMSGRFPRDWRCFHPNHYETWDGETFGEMPDICHRTPYVYTELINYARWLLEKVGFDGFRYDMVKGYGGWMVRSIQELRALRDGKSFKPYAVGECWDSSRVIGDWLDEANAWSDNPVGAFDFPLRWRLGDLCDSYGYSLRKLAEKGALVWDRPDQAVTFVENHDVVRDAPIAGDKLLAYAYILTHQGYPCVFWHDYFNQGLAKPDSPSGIDALIKVHENNAAGPANILYADKDLYIMQRPGSGEQPGLIFVLNNLDRWNGAWVRAEWSATKLVPAAWHSSSDQSKPQDNWIDEANWVDLWAPPRGYAVYIPE